MFFAFCLFCFERKQQVLLKQMPWWGHCHVAWNTVPQFRGEHHKMPGWNGNVEILSLLDCNPQWIEQKTSIWLVVSCQQEMLKWHGQSSCPWFRGDNLPDAPCKKIERPWILPMLQCEQSHFGNDTRHAWPKWHAMMNLPQMWRLKQNWCKANQIDVTRAVTSRVVTQWLITIVWSHVQNHKPLKMKVTIHCQDCECALKPTQVNNQQWWKMCFVPMQETTMWK